MDHSLITPHSCSQTRASNQTGRLYSCLKFVNANVDTPPGFDKKSLEDQYQASQFPEMPCGFAEPGKVLRLKKNLYNKKAALDFGSNIYVNI
jgi:hypothetical protein